jgi:arylsulfatase A-like enzyme
VRLAIAALILAVSPGLASAAPEAAPPTPRAKPNIVLIVSDDAGYADFSFQGSSTFLTPRIDSIAQAGVRFAQGYVTASVCSPSRAGLLTGRYQQRFGHEHNLHAPHRGAGLPLNETLLPKVLRRHGYRTIAVGKWHLGSLDVYDPINRGFDDWYGFRKGMRSYWPQEMSPPVSALREGDHSVFESFTYLTDELGRKAVEYIDRHHERPFFLYLSFNAVHTPLEAPAAEIERVQGESSPERRVLAAMTRSLDAAVGGVLDALERNEVRRNTLVIFLNDNGGPGDHADNSPLRGHKGTLFEGGIRVPFLAQWPGVLPAGSVYEPPVSALDVFPTVFAAATGRRPVGRLARRLDGVDLLPHLSGQEKSAPHDLLYWRRGRNWAIRQGPWKLVATASVSRPVPVPKLFHLGHDAGESPDLASAEPGQVERLTTLYRAWASKMKPPLWGPETTSSPRPRPQKPTAAQEIEAQGP